MSSTPTDLIPLAEACRLIPSRVPGKHLSLCTLFRWVLKGQIPAWRIGRYWYVSRAVVMGLATPSPVPLTPEAETRAEMQERARQTDEVLRKMGVRRG